jgi:outer membrane protein OmpA-like peptidoglycan-associated protein
LAISNAEAALKTAEEVNAQATAPLEMRAAEVALTHAREAQLDKRYGEASWHAYEAMMKARVATAKARQAQADRQLTESDRRVAEMTAQIEQLRRDEATLREAIEKRQQTRAEAERAEAARRELESRVQMALAKLTQVRRDQRGLVVNMPDILFEPGKATLTPGGSLKLTQIASTLKAIPIREIIVEGHTDSTGSPDFNMQLSIARAETVRMHLISAGVGPELIRTVGYGPSRPIAPNITASGRQQNRRVEVIVQEREDVALEDVEKLLRQ